MTWEGNRTLLTERAKCCHSTRRQPVLETGVGRQQRCQLRRGIASCTHTHAGMSMESPAQAFLAQTRSAA